MCNNTSTYIWIVYQLNKIPQGIEDNRGNVYIGRTSPPNVLKAYYEQYEKDFSTFLRFRSKEVVLGGIMVLTVLGRKSVEPYSKESCCMTNFLATSLNEMDSEVI
ncbi:Salicylate carboxymethyltransferase [Bienertia sinuspersici]